MDIIQRLTRVNGYTFQVGSGVVQISGPNADGPMCGSSGASPPYYSNEHRGKFVFINDSSNTISVGYSSGITFEGAGTEQVQPQSSWESYASGTTRIWAIAAGSGNNAAVEDWM